MKIFILSLFLSLNLFAEKKNLCRYSVDAKNIKVTWTAFKTPKKIGVSGTFSELGLNFPHQGSTIEEIIQGSSFKIDTSKVDTKDAARDVKIAQFFFKKMTGETEISGKVDNMDDKNINLSITMNEKTQVVSLKYQVKDLNLTASGTLDVLNFGMEESLKSITNACKEKHENKTWSDVDISLEAHFEKTCM